MVTRRSGADVGSRAVPLGLGALFVFVLLFGLATLGIAFAYAFGAWGVVAMAMICAAIVAAVLAVLAVLRHRSVRGVVVAPRAKDQE